MTRLADIVRDLRCYDEEPVSSQQPTIYASEPWTAQSQATVCWSMPKGGLPDDVAELRMVRLMEVRTAIRILAPRYEQLLTENHIDELRKLLIARVQELNRKGDPYLYNS